MRKVLCLLLGVVCFLQIETVYAAEISFDVDTVDNVYVERRISGEFSQTILHKYSLDGRNAFCLRPGVEFRNGNYFVSGVKVLSDENKDYAELVSYFSHGYSGTEDLYYYMAAQELIWEKLGVTNIRWKKGLFSNEYYNISSYIEDIQDKIEHFYDIPSFSGDFFEGYYGDEFSLLDENNSISTYEATGASNYSFGTQDDNLIIYFDNSNLVNEYITFRKKLDYDDITKYYAKSGFQTIGTFGISNVPEFSISVNTKGGFINLRKNFEVADFGFEYVYPSLEGAEYEIYNSSDVLVDTLITNDEGTDVSIELPYGEYLVKEVTAPVGYAVNEEDYIVNLDEPNEMIEVSDSLVSEEWTINKLYGSYITDEFNYEEGAVFEVYCNEEVIETLTTDKEGKVTFLLPYGIYTIKQLSGKQNYLFVDNFVIDVSGENIGKENIVNLFNEKYSSKLKILKYDQATNKLIKDSALFKIKNIETNKYILNSNDTYLFETVDGLLITDIFLEAGKYALEEEKAPNGYSELNKPIIFDIEAKSNVRIDSEDNVFELKVYNTKKPKLPQTSSRDNSYVFGICLILVAIIIKRNVPYEF